MTTHENEHAAPLDADALASMLDGVKTIMRPSQDEVMYRPLSDHEGEACATCRWFNKDGGGYCHLIDNYPLDILATGYCERHEVLSLPTAMPVIEEAVEGTREAEAETTPESAPVDDEQSGAVTHSWSERLLDGMRKALGLEPKPDTSGFKVYGDRWVAWWTNNFRDREGEFFTEKAIDDYIARVDMGVVPFPELWHYHIPGTKHGQADWLARVGHYCVASGTFDDTPMGQAAKATYASGKRKYAMSHGFVYDKRYKRDGIYHQFNTFELTTLPPRAAANAYTDFEGIKTMSLTPDKVQQLEALFGKEIADEILKTTDKKSKAIEDLGVEFKDFVSADDDTDAETEAAKEAVDQVETDLKTLIPELISDQSTVVEAALEAVKQVKALAARLNEQDATIAALREQLDSRPRQASKDAETELDPERLKNIADNAKKQLTRIDNFWGTEVSELPENGA